MAHSYILPSLDAPLVAGRVHGDIPADTSAPKPSLPTLSNAQAAVAFAALCRASEEYGPVDAALARELAGTLHGRPVAMRDVGAGFGRLATSPALTGYIGGVAQYRAVEPNEEMHAALREAGNALAGPHGFTIHGGQFEPGLGLPPVSFDVIVFSHSLYGMPSPAAILSHAATLLRPGGFVLIAHRASKVRKFAHALVECLAVTAVARHACVMELPADAGQADLIISSYLGVDLAALPTDEQEQVRRQVAPGGRLDLTQAIIVACSKQAAGDGGGMALADVLAAAS